MGRYETRHHVPILNVPGREEVIYRRTIKDGYLPCTPPICNDLLLSLKWRGKNDDKDSRIGIINFNLPLNRTGRGLVGVV